MDVKLLEMFLAERKLRLLGDERIAGGIARKAISAQLTAIESILLFVKQNQKREEDETMETNFDELKKALDMQARPISELKPRSKNSELATLLIDIAESIPNGSFKPIPTGPVKGKSIVAKVYLLKKNGKLPANVHPKTRGDEVFLVKVK